MRLLLIDNHDSFTAILHHYLWELAGEKPMLFRNDEIVRGDLEALAFDAVVLSPGPGHPANVRDFGICRDVLELFPEKPVLGVCLGVQGLAHFAGARIVPLPGAKHGRPSRIAHEGTDLFRGLPPEFAAIRYHSLVIDESSLPSNVRVTARSVEDGQVMGVRFVDRPWFGVQFHPESIDTEHGKALLGNFLDLARPERRLQQGVQAPRAESPGREKAAQEAPPLQYLELPWRDPAVVFTRLFPPARSAFWLDGDGWGASVMGFGHGVNTFHDWDTLAAWLAAEQPRNDRDVPWRGYRGGPIGQFSYELYRDTLGVSAPHLAEEPLGRWLQPEGWFVFDALAGKAWAAWDCERMPAWMSGVINSWDFAEKYPTAAIRGGPGPSLPSFEAWTPLLSEAEYATRVSALQEAIARGETYEACMTHAYSVASDAKPLEVFLRLRARNPAPFAAYLDLGDVQVVSASPELFLEASADGVLRSRPIKGTRRRGGDPDMDRELREDLAASEKEAAENRMIVDLTRHDLARVCVPGSVEVPLFLRVEEHPAVFQLVSEVRGRMSTGTGALNAIAACFPGGSMTGAPKERTVEILGELEAAPRGVYSGALGYLTRGGAFTLSMVIRTLVRRESEWTVGCGGAVLSDSDPEAEWREATVKARSVIDAASGEGPRKEEG